MTDPLFKVTSFDPLIVQAVTEGNPVTSVDGQTGAISLGDKYARVVAYNDTRPAGLAPVIWVGGVAGSPPAGALDNDVWLHQ